MHLEAQLAAIRNLLQELPELVDHPVDRDRVEEAVDQIIDDLDRVTYAQTFTHEHDGINDL